MDDFAATAVSSDSLATTAVDEALPLEDGPAESAGTADIDKKFRLMAMNLLTLTVQVFKENGTWFKDSP